MHGRPYVLAETNWKAVKDTDFELAVLPWGATEAHNYHLPYNTDVVQCDRIAAEAARLAWEAGAKVVVLPTVPFGVNTGQFDIKLDLNLNPSTQMAVLRDICAVLEHQGIRRLLILNGHGGNDFRQMVRELCIQYDLFVCTTDWYRWIDPGLFEEVGDHAGEMETSLMQFFAPEWVLPLAEAGDGHERKFKIKALREGLAWSQRLWTEATADTGIGDPKASTAEKGRRCFERVSAGLGGFMAELSAADPADMYE